MLPSGLPLVRCYFRDHSLPLLLASCWDERASSGCRVCDRSRARHAAREPRLQYQVPEKPLMPSDGVEPRATPGHVGDKVNRTRVRS